MTSVELLAVAAIEEGKFAQGFPSFGPERRGAPVAAFNRVDTKRIKSRAGIYKPDVVAVLDESLIDLVNVVEGLKPQGILIVNTQKTAGQIAKATGFKGHIGVVDARGIAMHEMGVSIANTTMIGALIKATGVVTMDAMKSPIDHRFGRIADKNMNAMTRAYNEIKIS